VGVVQKTLTPDFGTETEGRKADKGTPTESGDVVSVDASKVERIVLECGTCAGFWPLLSILVWEPKRTNNQARPGHYVHNIRGSGRSLCWSVLTISSERKVPR
jgi:hypothetical protein